MCTGGNLRCWAPVPCAPPEPAFGVQPLSALPHAPRYKKSTLPRAPVVPAHPSCLHPRDVGVSPFPPHPWLPHVSHHKAAPPWHPPPVSPRAFLALAFPIPQPPAPHTCLSFPRQPPPGALHCFKPTLPRRGLICSSNTLCNCSSPLPLPSQLLLLLKLEIATFKCFSEPPTGYNKNVAIGATRYKGL